MQTAARRATQHAALRELCGERIAVPLSQAVAADTASAMHAGKVRAIMKSRE